MLEILFYIGKHPGSTSSQIVNGLTSKTGKKSKYKYLLIEELNPPLTKKMHIFAWEDIQSTREAVRLYNLINNIQNFGKRIPYEEFELIDLTRPTTNQIIISYQIWKLIFDKVQDYVILTVLENERIIYKNYLIQKIIKSKCQVYIEFFFILPSFNSLKTKDSSGKKLFYLNGLGFLLLVTSDKYLPRLTEILLSKENLEEVPFLNNWEKFEKFGFRLIDELSKMSKVYKSQIQKCDNINMLLYRLIEYYYNQVSSHFGSLQFLGLLSTRPDLKFEYEQIMEERLVDKFIEDMREQQKRLLLKEKKRISIMLKPVIKIKFVSSFSDIYLQKP